MEENRRFSWSGLFIKVIIVIIFVLFTVWLLSLSNNGSSNSLDVLTNNIFSQNMEKMKEVGKDYFTTERLPKKIGDIETITLEKMYEKKLILELVDKNGNACSAKNSYVSVEKYDDEYQMKVYLECGNESDYIIVIMGCYDYCETDICEKVEDKEEVKEIEYQYSKTTGGKWTDYGKWSDWSKVSVSKTDYRQIETKIEKEKYSYDKTVTDVEYISLNVGCPEGYALSGNTCYKLVGAWDSSNPVCPTVSGYTYVSRSGFNCNYVLTGATKTTYRTASCPTGYTQSGTTCVKTTTTNVDPVCPTVTGYTYTGRNGFTCNYSKNSTNVEPVCPTISGYIYTSVNGLTCNYVRYVKGDYLRKEEGSYVPRSDKNYFYEEVGDAVYKYACLEECKMQWVHTYNVYKAKAENKTQTASCPAGSTQSGNACVKGSSETTTKTASCPTGSTKSGNTCVKTTNSSTTANPVCPTLTGYKLNNRNGFACSYVREEITKTASCPYGYTQVYGTNYCAGYDYVYDYEDLVTSCPEGYSETSDKSKCYKNIEKTETVTEDRDVTYYRYRVREFKGGTTDYKWSKSKEDKSLLNAGYKLTGKTR